MLSFINLALSNIELTCDVVKHNYQDANCCSDSTQSVTLSPWPTLLDIEPKVPAAYQAALLKVPVAARPGHLLAGHEHAMNGPTTDGGRYAYHASVGMHGVVRVDRKNGDVTIRLLTAEAPSNCSLCAKPLINFGPDDVTITQNKLFITSIFNYNSTSDGFVGGTLDGGARLVIDLKDNGFETAPLQFVGNVLSPQWTNPVNTNGEVVVYATAFGTSFDGTPNPSLVTVVRPSDLHILHEFSLTYNNTPTFINNFAIVGTKMKGGISPGGGNLGVAGYWGPATYLKYAEIDIVTGVMEVMEDLPSYILAAKLINNRLLLLSGDHKLYERVNEEMVLLKDIRADYNALSPKRPLAESFEAAFGLGGYAYNVSFIDNFYADSLGSSVYVTASISQELYTFEV